eukprot:COSAG01_NODE_11019_length_2026_cov_1.362221_2_plen_112_part_01
MQRQQQAQQQQAQQPQSQQAQQQAHAVKQEQARAKAQVRFIASNVHLCRLKCNPVSVTDAGTGEGTSCSICSCESCENVGSRAGSSGSSGQTKTEASADSKSKGGLRAFVQS